MVVVIGYQPENNWLDVINFKLPTNLDESYVRLNIACKCLEATSSSSLLSTFTDFPIFTTSFGIEGNGYKWYGVKYFDLYPWRKSSNTLTIRLQT